MGSYHSYVGDAKLEDSKDNWYRISGLSLSTRNFNTSEQETKAGDEYGFSLVSKGLSSTILFKAVNGFATRNQAFLTKIPNMVIGREFIIKDHSNSMDNILPFNGKLDSSGVQTLGKTFIKDNIGNRIFIISMDNDRLRGTLPDQADLQTALRPMLTLKPIGNNDQDGVFLNGMYELGTWDVFDNDGQRVTGYAEFLAILNNPNIVHLVADFGTGAKEIQLRQGPDGFLNYNSVLSYFIPFREEFSGIPARNFRYPPEITISVSTPNMKTYSYRISMGPLISNAGGIKKYKIMQTKI